jgi:hypothetical protein
LLRTEWSRLNQIAYQKYLELMHEMLGTQEAGKGWLETAQRHDALRRPLTASAIEAALSVVRSRYRQ